jgi:integration host factor subunit beta
MNKSELIEAMAEQLNLPSKTATSIVNTILESMADALVRGENVELRGFGSFTVREYETYTGRNPKTGELIKVKPKKLPFFKVGKELKEAVDSQATDRAKK